MRNAESQEKIRRAARKKRRRRKGQQKQNVLPCAFEFRRKYRRGNEGCDFINPYGVIDKREKHRKYRADYRRQYYPEPAFVKFQYRRRQT